MTLFGRTRVFLVILSDGTAHQQRAESAWAAGIKVLCRCPGHLHIREIR